MRARLEDLSHRIHLARSHFRYLRWLQRKRGFAPTVIYDIGACVLHWTRPVKELWPDAEVILFDAFEPAALHDGKVNVGGIYKALRDGARELR